MFVGACAGSTGGGLKVSRIIILFKNTFNYLKKLVHPNLVTNVHFEGAKLEEDVVKGVVNYFAVFVIILFTCILLISIDVNSFTVNFSAALTCLNNVGPGLELIGPSGNFSIFSGFSKIVLSLVMLIGRLEIFPMLIIFSPRTWRNR